MRRLRYLSLFLFLLNGPLLFQASAYGAELSTKKAASDLYERLSEHAVANHFVWAEGPIQEINTDWIADDLIGGVILLEPANKIDFPAHISVALHLDERLILSTEQSSHISAHTLSAVENAELRMQYIDWLKQEAKSLGFDHLILPDPKAINSDLAPLFDELLHYDTSFFLSHASLQHQPDSRRKKFYESTKQEVKVIPTEEFERYEKTLRRGPKKGLEPQSQVLNHLNAMLIGDKVSKRPAKATDALLTKLWKQAVVPVQLQPGVLPIKADTIAIWTSSISLVEQLDIYFNTVQNARFDQIAENIPVVIDGRENPMIALEQALDFADHPIIWVGDLNLMLGVRPLAMLYIPDNHSSLDHVIPEMLYGSEPIVGRFPKTIPDYLTPYAFHPVSKQELLGFSTPAWLQMDERVLDSIDWLAQEMIQGYGSPGAQVLVAKEGKIVLQKSYGFLTYDSLIPVQNHTLYDLASLTKVTATLLATMKLNQERKLVLDSTLGYYVPEYLTTNKSEITIRQLLAHQSGLKSYLPFWKRSLNGDFADVFYYKTAADAADDKRSYGYQPDPVMLDSLIGWIQDSPLIAEENAPYRYSDIGFMILHQIIESITGQSIESYLSENFYQPLGMYATCFNPLSTGVELFEIAPTEYDYYFRDEQVWGQVHDRNAAVFGGVAGHAGLFSNAKDLALLMQMLVQEGNYRDQQFVSSRTLGKFNQQYFTNNRRGLGWDKPGNYNPNISDLASKDSFGHTGFTGTMVWVDPKEELIFIFLSNRIFPDANNKNLIRLDTRKRMHDVIYRSLGKL